MTRSGPQELHHLAILGEPPEALLREEELSVPPDFEHPAFRLDQLRVDAERLLDFGRQTGGPRKVVSNAAVFDLECHLPVPPVARCASCDDYTSAGAAA